MREHPDHGRPQARKRFGQHFLESTWADKLARAIAPGAADTFLEIGPGPGALTERLCARAGRVVGVEIDRDMVQHLRVAPPANLHLIEGDVLAVPADRIRDVLAEAGAPVDSPVRVAGNLPYNVASPILFRLMALREAGLPITDATVMLQREVADRLIATPGTKEYGVLTVLVRHKSDVRRLLQLPPGAFRPPPKVHSTVVRLDFHPPSPPVASEATFAGVVQAVFTRRRKTLANALLAHGGASRGVDRVLEAAGIDGQRRPETLSVDEFARLGDAVESLGR